MLKIVYMICIFFTFNTNKVYLATYILYLHICIANTIT